MSSDGAAVRRQLSMNQTTVPRWSTVELLEGCARAGYGGAGLWRHRLEGDDLVKLGKRARGAGVKISSLCRGGFFLASGAAAREQRRQDSRRAADEAAALGARVLVLVCGPAPDRDLRAARTAITDAIAELAGYSADASVPLAIEAMHPLYCVDRSVVVTLDQVVRMAEAASGTRVGVVIDSYHLWWDPELDESMAKAGGRVLCVHFADWVVPLSDPLTGRGMLGDGSIDFRAFSRLVLGTGFVGSMEVEIFNPTVWVAAPSEVMETAAKRYCGHVLAPQT